MLQNITDMFPKSYIFQVFLEEGKEWIKYSLPSKHLLIKLYSHLTSIRPAVKFNHLKNAALAWKLRSFASCALIIVVFIWCKVQLIFFLFFCSPLLLSARLHQFTAAASSINRFLFPSSPQKHAAISIYSKDLGPPLFILAVADVSTCSLSSLLLLHLYFPSFLLLVLFLHTLKIPITQRCVSLPTDHMWRFSPQGQRVLRFLSSHSRPLPIVHHPACTCGHAFVLSGKRQ